MLIDRRPLIFTTALIPFITLTHAETNVTPKLFLTAQLGPYPISIYQHVVNTSRPDPLAPTPQNRKILTTIYRPFVDNFTCPVEYQTPFPYIPAPVVTGLLESISPDPNSSQAINAAKNDSQIFELVNLINCSRPISSSPPTDHVLLFSPGYGGTHDVYASTLIAAASSGYTVVAIDPTYEAAAIVFPDGQIVTVSNTTEMYDSTQPGEEFLQAVRVNDTISVLNAIEGGEIDGLACSARDNATCPPLRAAMFGHSFGGSAAINVALQDDRVIGSISMDGPLYAVSNETAVTKPLLWLQSQGGIAEGVTAGWSEFFQDQDHGWKSWSLINNTVHYSFTDLSILADLLGVPGSVIPLNLTGSINGHRLQEIVWRYTTQFFDYAFNKTCPTLLKGQNAGFPDVTFIGYAEASG